MKLLLVLLLMTGQLFAAEINFDGETQMRLGDFIRRLPFSVRKKVTSEVTEPRAGLKVVSSIPIQEGPFKLTCTNLYFNGSRWASSSKCRLRLDLRSPDVTQKFDEIKINITDPELVRGLRAAMPFGIKRKEDRSFSKDWAKTQSGSFGWVFHYYFSCGADECFLSLPVRQLLQ